MHINPYCWDGSNNFNGTWLKVTRSTTIGQLKTREIFNGGRRKCPSDSFTLGESTTGKDLRDDTTVGSIVCNDKGVIILYFYSCSYFVQKEGSGHSEYKTFAIHDFPNWSKAISEQLKGSIRKKKVQFTLAFPGRTIVYH